MKFIPTTKLPQDFNTCSRKITFSQHNKIEQSLPLQTIFKMDPINTDGTRLENYLEALKVTLVEISFQIGGKCVTLRTDGYQDNIKQKNANN